MFVTSKLYSPCWHTFAIDTCVGVLPFMETMQSFLKFVQRRDIFIVTSLLQWNLPRSIIYFVMWQQLRNQQWQTLVFFKGCYMWSYTQIHIKWVTNYNTNSIEHCAFLLNGKRCGCIGVCATNITSCLCTCTKLVEVECKSKLHLFWILIQVVSFMNSIWHCSWVWQIMGKAWC
jgi:hypothetical protein